VAAKSVTSATEDALRRHLASAYPTSSDPVGDALTVRRDTDLRCLVIIDGINEHLDPREFNSALKAFIRRYYGKPVTFLISCRDLYWRYFEDEWWRNHGVIVSKDKLYAFTRAEYARALPLYLEAFNIDVTPTKEAKEQLRHPLLLRFFCEAYGGTV